jgi:hypothetical protein
MAGIQMTQLLLLENKVRGAGDTQQEVSDADHDIFYREIQFRLTRPEPGGAFSQGLSGIG